MAKQGPRARRRTLSTPNLIWRAEAVLRSPRFTQQAALPTLTALPCFGHITAIFTKGSKQLAAYSGVHWYRPGRGLGGFVQDSMVGHWRSRHWRSERVLLVALLLAGTATVSGCSTVIDAIPTAVGGLP